MEGLGKQDLVGQLYALRAGLSAISVDLEKAKKIKADCDRDVDNAIEGFRMCECISLGHTDEQLEHNVESMLNGDCEKDLISRAKGSGWARAKRIIKLIVFMTLTICAAIMLYYCVRFLMTCDWTVDIMDKKSDRITGGIAVAAVCAVVIVLGIVFLIKFLIAICYGRRFVRRARKLLLQLPNTQRYIQAKLGEREQKIGEIIHFCMQLYSSLYQLYGGFFDERDWQNLDLVIYYCETHRADTLKEALILVERETQTQRIIQAIEDATARICGVLRQGFASLQEAMCDLSKQINTMQSIQSAQFANLTSAVNLNNALQEKANVTSKQLMEDVKVMRIQSDYAYRQLNS